MINEIYITVSKMISIEALLYEIRNKISCNMM